MQNEFKKLDYKQPALDKAEADKSKLLKELLDLYTENFCKIIDLVLTKKEHK